MWHAHVEHVSVVLRVFSNDKSYGDPYEFACTLRWIDSKKRDEKCLKEKTQSQELE